MTTKSTYCISVPYRDRYYFNHYRCRAHAFVGPWPSEARFTGVTTDRVCEVCADLAERRENDT